MPDNPNRCTAVTPDALSGGLRPLARCTLTDPDGYPHAGNHRASRSMAGVGKVVYRWKGPRADRPRPEVVLPTPRAAVRKRQARCICPDYLIGHMHVMACPLGSGV